LTEQRQQSSGRLEASGFSDRVSELLLRVVQIVPLLQIEPEIRTISAQLPKPQGHARGDRLLFREDIIKRLTRRETSPADPRKARPDGGLLHNLSHGRATAPLFPSGAA